MSLLKYVERLRRIDDLIRRRATGSAKEFSEKMHVSESQLFLELKEMKELGAPIDYSPSTRSYYYVKNCRLVLDFRGEGQALKGGRNTLTNFHCSDNIGVTLSTFTSQVFES